MVACATRKHGDVRIPALGLGTARSRLEVGNLQVIIRSPEAAERAARGGVLAKKIISEDRCFDAAEGMVEGITRAWRQGRRTRCWRGSGGSNLGVHDEKRHGLIGAAHPESFGNGRVDVGHRELHAADPAERVYGHSQIPRVRIAVAPHWRSRHVRYGFYLEEKVVGEHSLRERLPWRAGPECNAALVQRWVRGVGPMEPVDRDAELPGVDVGEDTLVSHMSCGSRLRAPDAASVTDVEIIVPVASDCTTAQRNGGIRDGFGWG